MMGGNRPKLIFALPRKTAGVAYAEANGGLFLQLIPGTDTVLQLAIARVILENGWEDKGFIERHIAKESEINRDRGRGTKSFGTDFAGYRAWLLGYEVAKLENAAKITGVPAHLIKRAAAMLAKPVRGKRPKASFALEKGNYWTNNYGNTASLAALGLVCGAGSRPGRVISRMGGHQRGWMGAAKYPIAKSPERLPNGEPKELDLDRWLEAGNVRFAWVIGTTWIQAMAASQELGRTFEKLTRGSPHQVQSADPAAIVETLKKRVDEGGLVVVDQDIYPVDPLGTRFADIVLPAATWGEEDFTRCNGERRLRFYPRFYDAPGEAKPDWWIVSRFAQKMGFQGFDWKSSNEVFEEAANASRGTVLDYFALVEDARRTGKKAHQLARKLGTTGIQCPIRLERGRLVGTKRLHDETLRLGPPVDGTDHPIWLTAFDTDTGKAVLHTSPWELFADFHERYKPRRAGEFWVINGRQNEFWETGFDDQRKPYIAQRWPAPWVEIHPADAKRCGIESGDIVRMVNDAVPIQIGGFDLTGVAEPSFSYLERQGWIRWGRAQVEAVAIVTDAVRRGVLFANALALGSPPNSLVPRVPDPLTNQYNFKLGKATRIRKVGESPYKRSFEAMTFKPRTIM
jgi:arsenite oxidase large subunit